MLGFDSVLRSHQPSIHTHATAQPTMLAVFYPNASQCYAPNAFPANAVHDIITHYVAAFIHLLPKKPPLRALLLSGSS